MRLPDFKVEQWMNDYENDAIYNMTDTCVKSLTLQELLDLEDFDFSNLILDYGQITGDIELKKEILKKKIKLQEILIISQQHKVACRQMNW